MATKRRPKPSAKTPSRATAPKKRADPSDAHTDPREVLRLEYVNVDDLFMDDDYQRPINKGLQLRITQNFTWHRFGAVTVTKRPDGTLWVVDGKQRSTAAKSLGATEVPCVIADSTGTPQEAVTFTHINVDRRAVSSIDRFRAAVAARDKLALQIDHDVAHTGYRIASAGRGKAVSCVSALIQAYKRNPEAAKRVLVFCCKDVARGEVVKSVLFRGLFEVELLCLQSTSKTCTQGAIGKKIATLGQEELIQAAFDASAFTGTNGPRAWSYGMGRAINKRMRTNKIALKEPE